jgi:hypothetical protein
MNSLRTSEIANNAIIAALAEEYGAAVARCHEAEQAGGESSGEYWREGHVILRLLARFPATGDAFRAKAGVIKSRFGDGVSSRDLEDLSAEESEFVASFLSDALALA